MVNRLGHMALPFLTLYLTIQRGFTPAEAGVLLSVYGICGVFGGLGVGFLGHVERGSGWGFEWFRTRGASAV